MSDLDRPRLALYVALGLVVCFLGARYLRTQVISPSAGGAAAARPAGPAAIPQRAPAAGGTASVSVDRADGGRVTVHVAGAVRRPGVYRLAAGSRVNDALRQAGGPARGADLTAVNLAAKLEDGRQILVPMRAPSAAVSGSPARAGGGAASGAPAVSGSATPAAAGAPATPINLNSATLEQLDTLDGVGPGIAQRILDYREQHGGFRRVEDLGEVPGIGDKRLAALAPMVTV